MLVDVAVLRIGHCHQMGMRKVVTTILLMTAILAGRALAVENYRGPFSTQAIYQLCSDDERTSREKCELYLQGLLYGIKASRSMEQKGMPVCLPSIGIEEARRRVLRLIDATTGAKPETNKDGGDWMAFLGLVNGNLCKK